jgi:hypothetical protein
MMGSGCGVLVPVDALPPAPPAAPVGMIGVGGRIEKMDENSSVVAYVQ